MRILASQLDSLLKSRFVDHQAGTGQDAFTMSLNDRFISRSGASEIVRIYNKPPAAAKNRKGLPLLAGSGSPLFKKLALASIRCHHHSNIPIPSRSIIWRHSAGKVTAPGSEDEQEFLAFGQPHQAGRKDVKALTF